MPTPSETACDRPAIGAVPALDEFLSNLPLADEFECVQSRSSLPEREADWGNDLLRYEGCDELLRYAKESAKLHGTKGSAADALAGIKRSTTPPEGKASKKAANGQGSEEECQLVQNGQNGQVSGPSQIYVCRYVGCGKSYASTDAVRKHCRQRHLEWLRSLGTGTPELYCQIISASSLE